MTLTTLADRDPHGTTTPCYVRPITARINFVEPAFARSEIKVNWLTGKVWGLSKKLSDLGKESNRAKILLQ